jgi:hypothetical protein
MSARVDIDALISYLQGTCNSLNDGLDVQGRDDMDMTSEDFAAVDAEIFLCRDCGWWCGVDERSEDDDDMCTDCGGGR